MEGEVKEKRIELGWAQSMEGRKERKGTHKILSEIECNEVE